MCEINVDICSYCNAYECDNYDCEIQNKFQQLKQENEELMTNYVGYKAGYQLAITQRDKAKQKLERIKEHLDLLQGENEEYCKIDEIMEILNR